MVPNALERCALNNRCDYACESVQYHIAHDNVHRLPKLLSREDAQIEETDRGLCQIDCEFVQNLSCPECLRTSCEMIATVGGLDSARGGLTCKALRTSSGGRLVDTLPMPWAAPMLSSVSR